MCVHFKVFIVLLRAKYYVTVYRSLSFATSKQSPKENVRVAAMFQFILYQNAPPPPNKGCKISGTSHQTSLQNTPQGALMLLPELNFAFLSSSIN